MDEKTIARFWSQVDKRGPDECWPWTGAKWLRGYGTIRVNGKARGAHRVAWWITNGPIPDTPGEHHGTCVCHRCDNTSCVNPDHLFLGSQRENIADCVRKGRHKGADQRGARNGHAKLSEGAVVTIRGLRAAGIGHSEIARAFAVTRGCVRKVVLRISWPDVP